jgi:hypothetical protein
MNVLVKPAMILGLAGAMALGAMTPSEARNGRWAAAGVGFAAGALIGGAVAANANRGYYYNEPYAYGYGERAYGYSEPVYVDPGYSYGYGYSEPGYTSYGYAAPSYAPRYRRSSPSHNYHGGSSGAAD